MLVSLHYFYFIFWEGRIPCSFIVSALLAPRPPLGPQKSLLPLFATSKAGCRLIVTAEEYAEIMEDKAPERPVMVFFTAPWCGPCRLSIPVVKDVVKQFQGKIDTVEICTDDLPDVAADAGVVSIPTIHLYFQGELLDTIIGCVAKTVLASAVEKVLEDVAMRFGVDVDDSSEEQ
jgi:thioredoxin 1